MWQKLECDVLNAYFLLPLLVHLWWLWQNFTQKPVRIKWWSHDILYPECQGLTSLWHTILQKIDFQSIFFQCHSFRNSNMTSAVGIQPPSGNYSLSMEKKKKFPSLDEASTDANWGVPRRICFHSYIKIFNCMYRITFCHNEIKLIDYEMFIQQ